MFFFLNILSKVHMEPKTTQNGDSIMNWYIHLHVDPPLVGANRFPAEITLKPTCIVGDPQTSRPWTPPKTMKNECFQPPIYGLSLL